MAITNNLGQTRVGVRVVPLSVVIPTQSALLDSYSGAAAAFSLRKLTSTYTGSAIRVRRSSDNTEQNIGFDAGGNLDTIALSQFVGSGSGFVTTWYDQSGNSRNVAQTTAANQPRIINSGSLELLNNKVCVSNYGQNQWLQLNSFGSNIASIFSFAMVGSFGNDSFRVALKFNPPSTGNNTKLQVNGFASLTSLEMQGGSSIYYAYPSVTNTTIQHIVQGTFNSANSELSVNNQTVVTGNAGGSTLNGIIIGADWAGSYPTSGKYQEVVVWGVNKSTDRGVINTALNSYYSIYPNPTSVWNLLTAVYSADTTASSSLKTSLFAAYNGESNANDSFGSNNGTAVGGLTYTTGKIGDAFQFNGTNAYVSLSNSFGQFNFTGDFTISTWINIPNYTKHLALFENYVNGGTYGYGYSFNFQTNNKFQIILRNGNVASQYVSTSGISTASWHHIVVVRKVGQAAKFYINGVLISGNYALGNSSMAPVYSGSNPCTMGFVTYGTTAHYSNHRQDATTIWNRELTASEITELYNSGNGAQYITNDFYKPTTNDALGTNNGTAQGGLTYGLGKIGTAFTFNGTNAYVSLPNNSLNFTGDFSISLWVYLTSFPGEQSPISNYYEPSPSSGGSKGWMIYISGTSLYWIVCGSSQVNLITSISSFQNTWKQITITFKNGVGSKIYFDGSLVTSNSSAITPIYNSTQTPFIGKYQYGNGSSFGYMSSNSKVDALNVWNKELTASEITELYNSGNGKQYPN